MVLAWRLSPPAYADTLTGEGNRAFGARWNSPGRGVVYASINLSLCVLEAYVHFSATQRRAIPDFEAVLISVPDDAGTTRISPAEMERLLSMPDPQSACRQVGDRWLAQGGHLLLMAPSVIVAEDENVMINPAHPRMRDVAIVRRRRFHFDPRLTVR